MRSNISPAAWSACQLIPQGTCTKLCCLCELEVVPTLLTLLGCFVGAAAGRASRCWCPAASAAACWAANAAPGCAALTAGPAIACRARACLTRLQDGDAARQDYTVWNLQQNFLKAAFAPQEMPLAAG